MLTFNEKKVFDAIRRSILMRGGAPTYDEICEATGVASRGNAHGIVNRLIVKGFLVRVGFGQKKRNLALAPTENTITIHLEPDMAARARYLADKAGVTTEAVLLEALRDRLLFAKSSPFQARETSREAAA